MAIKSGIVFLIVDNFGTHFKSVFTISDFSILGLSAVYSNLNDYVFSKGSEEKKVT